MVNDQQIAEEVSQQGTTNNRSKDQSHGGQLVGQVLARHGVKFLFTLCGGHISPILTGSEENGIRVIDVRHEVTAVFAADAMARLSGIPGVAAVTAGPGLTNTITALKNAEMAQSPVVLLGGATPTLLMGRGSLQDIDQKSLIKPHVKWMQQVRRVRDIVPALEEAFYVAQSDVPGPVFVELPIDTLYPEYLIREQAAEQTPKGTSISSRAIRWYIQRHLRNLFADKNRFQPKPPRLPQYPSADLKQITTIRDALLQAEKPVFIVGTGAMMQPRKANVLAAALRQLGVPTFLSGMARGLLGKDPLHIRHKRSKALKEADLVLLAGVPCDFRLGYGNTIPSNANYIAINRSKKELNLNRRPNIGVLADPCDALIDLANFWNEPEGVWSQWHQTLIERNNARDREIVSQAELETEHCNPVQLCIELETAIGENSIIIGDGGDFVGTASYIVRPRKPLNWLDPGAFGTLGAGAGFALAAKLHNPDAEVWLLYGDGSAGYSIAEFDTFARHNLPVIAVVGTDGGWTQIAREQVDILGTALGTELAMTAYHDVAKGYGADGLLVQNDDDLLEAFETAQSRSKSGTPVLVNAWIGSTDFRKGSISM